MEHDHRYDRADEFMSVVLGHWDAWDDDALSSIKRPAASPIRPKCGVSTMPARFPLARPLHRAAHATGPSRHHPGRAERPRPPLRRALGRGHLRHRDGPPAARKPMPRMRRRSGTGGPRSRRDVVCTAVTTVCGRDQGRGGRQDGADRTAPARDRQPALLSEGLNFDFGRRRMDEPLTERGAGELLGLPVDPRRRRARERQGQTPRCATSSASQPSRRGRGRDRRRSPGDRRPARSASSSSPPATGSSWRHARARRLRRLRPLRRPELQRRGLYHRDYAGATLRENLGLPRPAIGAWKALPVPARIEARAASPWFDAPGGLEQRLPRLPMEMRP